MNDKLKQSLDGRLGGMRWGERDQAEVFRQIQKKELQNVKHVKRGTGALAIAIALLFVVMGAAFALNQTPQPEDQRVAVQPTDTAILPISTALYENEHFTLTIDSTTCTASEAAFTGTIRMKNPAEAMLSLDSHTPPGNAGRTIIPVDLRVSITTMLPGNVPLVCNGPADLDVLDMTADTTVFRMSCEVTSLREDATFTLWIDWTDPADGTEQSDKLTWRMDAPAQQGMLLEEFDLVTVLLADYTADGGIARMAIDIIPAKPWYVLNRQEEGKASLTVSAEPLLLYPTFDPYDMLDMVESRDPTAGEMPVTLTQTAEGLRLTAEGPLPTGIETLYGYIVLHVYSDAAEAHYDEGFDDHYYEVCVPVVPLEEAVEAAPTATPAPMPEATAAPTPQPATHDPNRMWIFENDLLTAYAAGTEIEDELLRVNIDVIPKNAEHVINTSVPGKTSLYVSTSWYGGYDGETPLRPLSVENSRFVATEEGASLSALLPFPAEHQTVTFTLHVTTMGNGAEYANPFICTIYRPGAYPYASPTPAPQRAEPTGKYIGGTERFSAYLEDSWHDGFSAEATLRIRSDDPGYTLDITPNKREQPSENTWIVGLQGGVNEYYNTIVTPTMWLEAATGDVIIHLTYQNPYGSLYHFTKPLALTVTNEKTWSRESAELFLWLEPVADYPRQTLHLIGGDNTDAFLRAASITTDRYHYIGVMSSYNNVYSSLCFTDAAGNVLASSNRSHIVSTSEDSALFPAEGDGYVTLSIVRLDNTTPLPEVLHVHFHSENKQDLPHYILGSVPHDAQTVIHENEYVLITLHSDWYDGQSASLTLQATLKNPEAYAFVESADSTPPEGKLGIALTSMVGWCDESFSHHLWMSLSRPWALDNSILWQAKAFDIDVNANTLHIGGYLWLTTPYGEETIALNHSIPLTGLWRDYTLTPITPAKTIRIERASLHAGTHASYYTIDYVLADPAQALTLRIASVNDAPLSVYSTSSTTSGEHLNATIVTQTRLTPQTAILQVCTADGEVLEEIPCQISEVTTP